MIKCRFIVKLRIFIFCTLGTNGLNIFFKGRKMLLEKAGAQTAWLPSLSWRLATAELFIDQSELRTVLS